MEAAARHRRPIFFRVIGPWTVPVPGEAEVRPAARAFGLLLLAVVCGVLLVLGVLARRNVILGRGDRRGAFRLAVIVGSVSAAARITSAHWAIGAPSMVLLSLLDTLLNAFGVALLAWLAYVGFEPYVRRRWPHILVAWTRLLEGRWRDPLVGRSILVGLILGCAYTFPYSVLLPRLMHLSGAAPAYVDRSLDNNGMFVGMQIQLILGDLFITFLAIAVAVIARLVLRNTPAAMVVLGVAMFALNVLALRLARPSALSVVILILVCAVFNALLVWSLWRTGALTFTTAFVVGASLENIPWTVDVTRWYAWRGWFAVAVLVALAVWGFRSVLGKQSAFPAGALDE